MKPIHQQREGHTSAHQSPAMTVRPPRDEEILQEQMRRLHNARASQRAARHHRAGQFSI
jgi:hypothetical protein